MCDQLTKTLQKNNNTLNKFAVLAWAAFVAVLRHMQPEHTCESSACRDLGCRGNSAKHPGLGSLERTQARAGSPTLRPFLHLPRGRELKFGKLGNLDQNHSPCGRKQPGLRNQNHMGLTCLEGAAPYSRPLAGPGKGWDKVHGAFVE